VALAYIRRRRLLVAGMAQVSRVLGPMSSHALLATVNGDIGEE
jgi:hypothetical protein